MCFSRYSSSDFLVHDRFYPHLILDVVPTQGSYRRQLKKAKAYQRRYERSLRLFRKIGRRAANKGAIERRVWQVYNQNSKYRKHLLRGKASLRTQQGMKETFKTAKVRAAPYIRGMERMFRYHNLPPELTRIAFIESMFNPKAKSKVDAAGLWQLMPYVAKPQLKMNRYTDERMAPLKSTEIAAKHLKGSFKMLKSWPLAITGYNHGPTGVKRATRRMGSRDINHLVEHYRGRRFGFASRNFYAEFLAAKDLTAGLASNYGRRNGDEEVVRVKVPRNWSLARVIRRSGLSLTDFKRFNPHLKKRAYRRKNYFFPSRGYHIALPATLVKSKPQYFAIESHPSQQKGLYL